MKRFALAMFIIALTATAALPQSQEQPAQNDSAKSDSLGVSVKLEYNSRYLWRGTDYYDGDGVFFPQLSWEVFNTGLVLTFMGEFSESYFFEGNTSNQNATAFANHGLDWGIDYSYTFGESITLGVGLWYFWYYNSGTSWATNEKDVSFLSAMGFVKVDMIPLEPTLTIYYDYYPVIDRGGDFYIELSLGHDFALTDEVAFHFSISSGYYYQNSNQATIYNEDGTVTFTPVRKGFSDITTFISLNFKQGYVGIVGGFGYVIVPAESWYKGSDIHRFYASFSASLSI